MVGFCEIFSMITPRFIFPIALSLAWAPFADAMIASVNGEATHNTTATDYVSEIWNRTVELAGGTGTYLGQSADGTHWVMTAAHVTVGTGTIVTSTGETINLTAKAGQEVFFYNADGTKADLQLFAVSAANAEAESYLNALGNIEIYTGDLYTNTPLYCVGTGCNLSIGSGISAGTRVKQWGEFCADGLTPEPVAASGFKTHALIETFSVVGNSIQCGKYDSGSGVFVNNGGTWEAVGVAITVGAANEGASKVGYKDAQGENKLENPVCYTMFTDLSAYASQIYAVIPEPSFFGLMAGAFALGLAGVRCRR